MSSRNGPALIVFLCPVIGREKPVQGGALVQMLLWISEHSCQGPWSADHLHSLWWEVCRCMLKVTTPYNNFIVQMGKLRQQRQ